MCVCVGGCVLRASDGEFLRLRPADRPLSHNLMGLGRTWRRRMRSQRMPFNRTESPIKRAQAFLFSFFFRLRKLVRVYETMQPHGPCKSTYSYAYSAQDARHWPDGEGRCRGYGHREAATGVQPTVQRTGLKQDMNLPRVRIASDDLMTAYEGLAVPLAEIHIRMFPMISK